MEAPSDFNQVKWRITERAFRLMTSSFQTIDGETCLKAPSGDNIKDLPGSRTAAALLGGSCILIFHLLVSHLRYLS